MGELPYAIMCELRELAGAHPSMNFRPVGSKAPSPEAMLLRRAHIKPLSAADFAFSDEYMKPTSKFETSASLQDLVDFGLIRHGYWHDGDRQTTDYGFHLTEKAMEYLKPSTPPTS